MMQNFVIETKKLTNLMHFLRIPAKFLIFESSTVEGLADHNHHTVELDLEPHGDAGKEGSLKANFDEKR